VRGKTFRGGRGAGIPFLCFCLAWPFGAAAAQDGPHTGPVEEALAAIEAPAGKASTPAVRRGNGFVLRCDGFLLVPAGLFEADSTVTVILHPGTDHERRIANVRPPSFFAWRRAGYAVLKLDGIHAPALRTRLATPNESGLSLVSARWEAGGRYGPLRRAAASAAGAPSAAGSPGGVVPLALPVPDTPPGAVVVGKDGLAVGMVTGGAEGAAASFLSFEELGRVTNCVTPVPTDDETFRRSEEALPKDSRMVEVGGGRVPLPAELLREQPDLSGVREACVAPFRIDRYEVTNAEYLEFWRSLDESRRPSDEARRLFTPRGWSASDPPFPEGMGRLPVLGVPLEGARAYARWRGKRLPTPSEWLLAAFGPGGPESPPAWVPRYLADRVAAWRAARERHNVFARDHVALLQRDAMAGGQLSLIPWITREEAARDAARFSKGVVEAETAGIDASWSRPNAIREAGSRPFDVSPSGARDMILNAAEIFAPAPQPPAEGKLRYWRADWRLARPDGSWPARVEQGLAPPMDSAWLSALTDRSLNRLIGCGYEQEKRSGFTLANITYTVSSLNEQAALLAPLSRLALRIGGQMEASAALMPETLNVVNRYLATGIRLWTYEWDGNVVWQQVPRDYRAEAGSVVALHLLDLPIPEPVPGDFVRRDTASLTYLVPVGFRCAR
jgi:hypothetical protein